MLPFLRLSGVASLVVRLVVIGIVAFVLIQQFGSVSFLPLSPFDVFGGFP